MTDTEKQDNAARNTQLPPQYKDSGLITQTQTPEAGLLAHLDPEAQAEVQKKLNERIVLSQNVPYKRPKVPPGTTPNQIIALAQAGALEQPQQTDQPVDEEEEEDEKPGKPEEDEDEDEKSR